MELEEAIKELKNIWKETDFENSKRRVAIETVLKELEKVTEERDIFKEEHNKITKVLNFKEGSLNLSAELVIESLKKALENVDNYKATSYTSEYFRGVNECEDKWKKKIKDKINKLDLEIDKEYEKSMAYHQLVYARCELQELLEDK